MSDQQLEKYAQHDLQKEVAEPDMFRVILLNDHYTTQDFVVEILVHIFHKTSVESTRIMMEVHTSGKGLVGIYPYDIALTRVTKVKEIARKKEFPLQCIMEKV